MPTGYTYVMDCNTGCTEIFSSNIQCTPQQCCCSKSYLWQFMAQNDQVLGLFATKATVDFSQQPPGQGRSMFSRIIKSKITSKCSSVKSVCFILSLNMIVHIVLYCSYEWRFEYDCYIVLTNGGLNMIVLYCSFVCKITLEWMCE